MSWSRAFEGDFQLGRLILIKADKPKGKVQKFAGHKDFRTTLNYIHLEDEDLADVAATMRSWR
jgi:hypothetical protein